MTITEAIETCERYAEGNATAQEFHAAHELIVSMPILKPRVYQCRFCARELKWDQVEFAAGFCRCYLCRNTHTYSQDDDLSLIHCGIEMSIFPKSKIDRILEGN